MYEITYTIAIQIYMSGCFISDFSGQVSVHRIWLCVGYLDFDKNIKNNIES